MAGHLAIGMNSRAGAVAMVRMWSHLGKSLGQGLQSYGESYRARAMTEQLAGKLESIHASYRLINPVHVPRPAEGQAVTASPVQTAVVTATKTVAQTAAEHAKKRGEDLRSQGVPEEAITALLHAERQTAGRTNQPGQQPNPAPSAVPQRTEEKQQNINPRRTP